MLEIGNVLFHSEPYLPYLPFQGRMKNVQLPKKRCVTVVPSETLQDLQAHGQDFNRYTHVVLDEAFRTAVISARTDERPRTCRSLDLRWFDSWELGFIPRPWLSCLVQVHERGVDADLLSMVIKLLMLLASIFAGHVQFPNCSWVAQGNRASVPWVIEALLSKSETHRDVCNVAGGKAAPTPQHSSSPFHTRACQKTWDTHIYISHPKSFG